MARHNLLLLTLRDWFLPSQQWATSWLSSQLFILSWVLNYLILIKITSSLKHNFSFTATCLHSSWSTMDQIWLRVPSTTRIWIQPEEQFSVPVHIKSTRENKHHTSLLYNQQLSMFFSVLLSSHVTILNDSTHAEDRIPAVLLFSALEGLSHVGLGWPALLILFRK